MADEKKEEAAASPADVQMAKKRKIMLFAGIGGVAVICLIVAILLLKNSKGHTPAPTDASASTAQGKDAHADPHAAADDKNKKPDDKAAAADHKPADAKAADNKDAHGNAKDAKPGDKKDEKIEATKNFGDTYLIPRIELNLGNPMENRYVRMGVAFEYRGGPEQGAELKQREAQIKDILITSVTTKSRVQLLSENGKELLRKEILNKVNEVVDKPVQNVFFTDFLVE